MNTKQYTFRLDEILLEREISIRQFAADAGLHYKTALNMCHNHTTGISLETLSKVCQTLNITPDKLFKINTKK